MMTTHGSERVRGLATRYAFWLATLTSFAAILLSFTTVWQLCIIPPVIGSLLFIREKARLAWWSGFLGVGLAWLALVLYFIATQPAMAVADLIMWIIAESPGLGWAAAVLTVGIGACLGGFGGLVGFAAFKSISKGDAGNGDAEQRAAEPVT